jgi:hypothetical protein
MILAMVVIVGRALAKGPDLTLPESDPSRPAKT